MCSGGACVNNGSSSGLSFQELCQLCKRHLAALCMRVVQADSRRGRSASYV